MSGGADDNPAADGVLPRLQGDVMHLLGGEDAHPHALTHDAGHAHGPRVMRPHEDDWLGPEVGLHGDEGGATQGAHRPFRDTAAPGAPGSGARPASRSGEPSTSGAPAAVHKHATRMNKQALDEQELEGPSPSLGTSDLGPGYKPRLRWTPELHERFAVAVADLGGAFVATPKQIMHIMDVEGLTIFHIKSHLQKFRQNAGPVGKRGKGGSRSRSRSRAARTSAAEAPPAAADDDPDGPSGSLRDRPAGASPETAPLPDEPATAEGAGASNVRPPGEGLKRAATVDTVAQDADAWDDPSGASPKAHGTGPMHPHPFRGPSEWDRGVGEGAGDAPGPREGGAAGQGAGTPPPPAGSAGAAEMESIRGALSRQMDLQRKLLAQLEAQRELQRTMDSNYRYIVSLMQVSGRGVKGSAVAPWAGAGGERRGAGGAAGRRPPHGARLSATPTAVRVPAEAGAAAGVGLPAAGGSPVARARGRGRRRRGGPRGAAGDAAGAGAGAGGGVGGRGRAGDEEAQGGGRAVGPPGADAGDGGLTRGVGRTCCQRAVERGEGGAPGAYRPPLSPHSPSPCLSRGLSARLVTGGGSTRPLFSLRGSSRVGADQDPRGEDLEVTDPPGCRTAP